MNYGRAHRLDKLISLGCDDATIAKEGYTLEEISFQRVFTESKKQMDELMRKHGLG